MKAEITLPPTTEFEQVNIKDLNEEELFANLLSAGEDWTKEQRDTIIRAHDLIHYLHRDDEHREQPYVYHLLRSANRITQYLHITNPHIIAGVLLHDSVEDHAKALIRYFHHLETAPGSGSKADPYIPDDTEKQQLVAFDIIARRFSRRTSRMVQGMTNPPVDRSQFPDRKSWLLAYVGHIAEEIKEPDVFLGKWSDWADNGLGIVHSGEDLSPEREEGFKEKYGLVMPVLEDRFYQIDIQSMLDDVAKQNVIRSFELAHERLHVPPRPVIIGNLVLNTYEPA